MAMNEAVGHWLPAVAAGLFAAGLGWGAAEAAAGRFPAATVGNPAGGPQQGGVTIETVKAAAVKDAALACTLQGAALGLVAGLAGAATRGATPTGRRAGVAGPAGLVLGAAAGSAAAMAVFPAYLRSLDPLSDSLIPPLMAHGLAWGAMGAAAGLAYGLGRGRSIARGALGGVVGALIGTALYDVGGALLFASAQTSHPMASKAPARLLASAAVGLLTPLGAAAVVGPSPAAVPEH